MTTAATRALPPPPASGPLQRLGRWFLRRWTGRIVGVALAIVILDLVGLRLPDPLVPLAWVITCVFAWIAGYRLFRWMLRRWLWRIRTKLLLSYLFVTVVPLVLLTVFFALVAVLFSGVVASYMVTAEIERRAEELERATSAAFSRLIAAGTSTADGLERELAPLREAYPELSYALVRDGRRLAASGTLPDRLPPWLKEGTFAGLARQGGVTRLRSVAGREDTFLMLDVPLDGNVVKGLDERAGIRIIAAGGRVRTNTRGAGVNIEFEEDEPSPGPSPAPPGTPRVRARRQPIEEQRLEGLIFMATPDQTDWDTGAKDATAVAFQYQPLRLMRTLSPGKVDTASMLVTALAAVGGVFLLMYGVALLMGALLARSITRSVHALSRGTERLRQGRFDRPIPVHSRDQLGELAESFNLMSSDIQQFMRESAEKERLEEELRIARRIQMSLLPQGTVTVPHVSIAAICIPANEVGGDYYDLLPLPGDRLAVLMADVSGKGTSAALYMAELKGLMLSLSRVHDSPADALAEANRILTADMDARSFITMSYAVVDPLAARMRYARAGHSPLIVREARTGATRLLAPPGLGLGLDAGAQFERVLEETEIPLASGDVFLFFTDGLSEAMNVRGELFGEERLRDLLQREGGDLGAEEMRDRVLEEVRTFVGDAPQHDDMTMVVIRIE